MNTFLYICSFLFIIFINSFPSSAANEANEIVLDIHGKPLQVGAKYYAVSAIWGAGGRGLTLTNYPNEECRVTVSQDRFELGIPLSFRPARTREGLVFASKSMIVKFETSVPCAKSTVWQVGSYDPQTNSQLIQINGVEGPPGCETFRNYFKIVKVSSHANIYRFVSDPDDICPDIPIAKFNVSTRREVTKWPLSLSPSGNGDQFFPAVFIKYEEDVGIKQYV